MLLSFNGFRRYSINATDGELGTVKDVYLSDDSWLVRYMVVDTGVHKDDSRNGAILAD